MVYFLFSKLRGWGKPPVIRPQTHLCGVALVPYTINQGNRHVIHIGSRWACDNQPACCLEPMVSIVFGKDIRDGHALLCQSPYRIAVGVSSGGIRGSVGSVTSHADDADIGKTLNSRRGRVEGMEDRAGAKVIHAMVPLSEMFAYSNDLRSRTQGRGQFTMQFDHYEEVPKNIAEKIAAK